MVTRTEDSAPETLTAAAAAVDPDAGAGAAVSAPRKPVRAPDQPGVGLLLANTTVVLVLLLCCRVCHWLTGTAVAAFLPQAYVQYGYWAHCIGPKRRFRGIVRLWLSTVFVAAFDGAALYALRWAWHLSPVLAAFGHRIGAHVLHWALHAQAALPVPDVVWRFLAWYCDFMYWPYIPLLIVAVIVVKADLHFSAPRAWLMHVLFDVPAVAVVALWDRAGERMNRLITADIDDVVALGSLPFSWSVPALEQTGVTHVINLCAEWPGPRAAYAKAGITQLRLQWPDNSQIPLRHVTAAVDFIESAIANPNPRGVATAASARPPRVFVHCKAGMGRSATVVLCYLMKSRRWTPRQCYEHMKSKRQEVVAEVMRFACVHEYARQIGIDPFA